MPNNKNTRFVVQSRMVIGGKVKTSGDRVSLDYTDPQVRGWVRAGNIQFVPKKRKEA